MLRQGQITVAQIEKVRDTTMRDEASNEKPMKTKYFCAIEEKDLNKVELAYFRRPMNNVILSDRYALPHLTNFYRDANRLLKG